MKRTNVWTLAAITGMAIFVSCFNSLAEPNSAKSPPPAKGMGRVEIRIAGSEAKTLLPDNSGIIGVQLDYKIIITKDGADTSAVNATFSGNSWTGELETGVYTAEVVGCKPSTSQAVARGSERFTVNGDGVNTISIGMSHIQEGIGVFLYTVNVTNDVFIVNGKLRLVPFSGDNDPANILLTGNNLNNSINIAAGYYQIYFEITGIINGQIKIYQSTVAAHVANNLITRAFYNLTGNDFNQLVFDYFVTNSIELDAALSGIKAGNKNEYFIIVSDVFQSDPISLTALEFTNKTINLWGHINGKYEIRLKSNGSLFTVGSDVELVIVNITLRGSNTNNAPLVKINTNGKLVVCHEGKLTGNTYAASIGDNGGAGIFLNGGILEIAGGEISENILKGTTTFYGGGIYADNSSTIIMTGGTIKENQVEIIQAGNGRAGGGGIVLNNTSSFEMLDGNIEGNICKHSSTIDESWAVGGGVVIGGNSLFYFRGGKIRNNTCNAVSTSNRFGRAIGGGIHNEGKFLMSGGIINGNSCISNIKPNYFYTSGWPEGAYGGGYHSDPYGFSSIVKTGGIIYGSEAVGNDVNGIPLRNMAQSDSGGLGGGHALFINKFSPATNLKRNSTSYDFDNLDSGTFGSAGGWE
jgi:hypothetical protein